MNENLVTIAVHQLEKATIAKQLLEQQGVAVELKQLPQTLLQGAVALGYQVQVRKEDVNNAIALISRSKLLSYTNSGIFKNDDQRPRILVAVDFSDYSMRACEAAFEYAEGVDGKVKILNVFSNMRYPLHMPFADIVRGEGDNTILDKARRNMLSLCQQIDDKISKGEMPSVNYSYSLREGIVEEEVENYVEEYKPKLLLIGSKGMGNNAQNIIGNVAADIIETTSVPIMAVPLHSKIKKLKEIKHIGFLTNVDKRDLQSFDKLVKLVHAHSDVKVTLIHINFDPKGRRFNEEQLAAMHTYFQARYPELNIGYELINTSDMIDALDKFITEEEVGMLCLNTRKRNILGRIFMPSMSRKLLTSLDIHLMVLRD